MCDCNKTDLKRYNDYSFCLMIWFTFDLEKMTRTGSSTMIFLFRAALLFCTACFLISLYINTLFFGHVYYRIFRSCTLILNFHITHTCTLVHICNLPKLHLVAFHAVLYIVKIYLSHFTWLDILVVYMPVPCNRLINKYLSSRIIYWFTCHCNLPAIEIDLSHSICYRKKCLYCATKYSMTYVHVYLWRCINFVPLSTNVKLTGLSFNFERRFIFCKEISLLFLAYLLCNLCYWPCIIFFDMIRFWSHCMFILYVLSFLKLSFPLWDICSFRPFYILAAEVIWILLMCTLRLSFYLLAYQLCNWWFRYFLLFVMIRFRPFRLFANDAFRPLFYFNYFLDLTFLPNLKYPLS